MRFLSSIPRAALASLMLIALAGFATDVTLYQQSVEKWRQDYEAKLKSDSGWLSVAGLFWLHEGENFFGSDPDNDIVLPYPSMPGRAGKFQFHQGATVAYITSDLPVTMKGKPVSVATLHPDSPDERLVTGDLLMYVHASGGRFAIRLKDKNSKLRREFHGTTWFPVNEAYRVTARYTRLEAVRPVEIETVLGDHEKLQIAGYCTFKLNGEEIRLDAEQDETGALFIVFRDLTSAKDTYPAARFLDTLPPKDGTVELDFNKAYNPPCAYNPYTTCPLPAPGNRLRLEIPAGEKRYHQ